VTAHDTAQLPLRSFTPLCWGTSVLRDPMALLIDHAFLEKKAATNALELLHRWPHECFPGWAETLTNIARDETIHLSQVVRLVARRGGHLQRGHRNQYAKDLRLLVRIGGTGEIVDRLLVSALIELRSCERFSVLTSASVADPELQSFYKSLFASEFGHYTVFLKLARKIESGAEVDRRWAEVLKEEARIIAAQEPGPRIHSGLPDA
jgi:tRNA 2-(methylsulfanyl)-N6-isopentenyladenosine37 hydroxylase